VIGHGVNGFLVTSLAEAVEAVDAARSLERVGVRRSIETRFCVDRMVDEYLAPYHRLLGR
jgi:hypothetical protein